MDQDTGITSGLGVMISYVVIITFVPAILTWVDPPKREEIRRERTSMFTNVTTSLVARLLRWRWAILIATAIFTAGAGYVALYGYDEYSDVISVLAFKHQKEAGYE